MRLGLQEESDYIGCGDENQGRHRAGRTGRTSEDMGPDLRSLEGESRQEVM